MEYAVSFPTGTVRYVAATSLQHFDLPVPAEQCVVITDSNIAALYQPLLQRFGQTIVIPAGESYKSWDTVQSVTTQLLQNQVHKHSLLIGVGGGMVTDITGFLATIYMRGVPFGFVPTSLLAMVDAAIGGKNGINIDTQKNLLGTITQPSFILFDTSFLDTLPRTEWQNGFAEIIKYACLFDAALFDELASHNLDYYIEDKDALWHVAQKCIAYKNKMVQADETDNNARKLLNFGHTAGHAIEKLYDLPHGQAVAIGMVIACRLSEITNHTDHSITKELKTLLHRYELPVHIEADTEQLMHILKMDKKRNQDVIDYIILNKKGEGAIKPLSFAVIQNALTTLAHAGSN